MSDIITTIIWIAGAIGTLSGTVFAVRKLWQLARPIEVCWGIKRAFDNSGPDEITAVVTNKSRETQYIVECSARSTFSLWVIVGRHLRNPLVRPKLYNNIWFGGMSFDMLGKVHLKLEPFERTELAYKLSEHPLQLFLTPMLQVEVRLSTGRVFRSERFVVPERWRFRGSTSSRGSSAQQSAASDAAKPRG